MIFRASTAGRALLACIALMLILFLPATRSAAAPRAASTSLQAIVTSTDLTVGLNRFTFGLLSNNRPVSSGRPTLIFYLLHGSSAVREMSTTANFNDFARGLKGGAANLAAVDLRGVFVAYPRFRRAGTWGVQVETRYKGHLYRLNSGFTVLSRSLTPGVGSLAPRSNNPTVRQESVSRLDSGRPPDDMHKMSIAQAIKQHKPLVIIFSTPAFCTSRMCGPQTEIVQRLEPLYRRRVNFIHIEIYKDANPAHGYARTVRQWHLQTEPWVFVVDRRGRIAAKFEGPTSASEIERAIAVARKH